MKVNEIINEVRNTIAKQENRSIIDVNAIGRNSTKTIERPLPELRPDNLIEVLGIKYLQNLSNNVGYPLIDGQVCFWLDESEDPSSRVSDITFSSCELKPRRLFSYTEYDKQILLSSDADIQGAIQEDLELAMYEKLQDTMFNEVYDDNDNAAETISDYSDIVALELAAAQAKIKNPVYLVSPIAASKIKTMTNNVFPVWMGDKLITGKTIIETPFLSGEKVILGDFSRMVVANWDKLSNYTLNSFTKAKDGICMIIINSYWDWGLIDPNAFLFASTAANNN